MKRKFNTNFFKRTIACALVLCFFKLTQAQNTNGSPNKNMKKGSYSEKKGRSLGLASRFLDSAKYYSSKNPLRAIDFINKAIEESISESDKTTQSTAYTILGNIQQGLSQHDLAIENYKKSISVIGTRGKIKSSSYGPSELNHNILFNAYKHMSISYLELNDLENAFEKITACLEFQSVPKTDLLSAKRILAVITWKKDESQESLALLNTVLIEEKYLGNIPGEIETYLALGGFYQSQKNEEKAIEQYTKAKVLAEKNNQSELALRANDFLAKIFRKQKNVTKELETRNSNIRINTSNNNSQAIVKENIEIGNAYQNTNQLELAKTYYDKGLTEFNSQEIQTQVDKKLFLKSNDLDETAKTYKLLAESYLKQKDLAKALDYFNKYSVLQDSIKQLRNRELDEAISLSNSLGKNQQRIDLLEKERQLSEKSLEILKKDQDLKEEELDFKNIIIGVLIFFLLFMLLAGYFLMRSAGEKRRINQLLALKSLRGQMNPHFIFNALNSVNHYISQNDERKANRYLSDFSKLMRMVMDSSKHSLISLNDELEMLRLYLQLEHTRFSDKFDYTVEVNEHLNDGEFELPPMLIQPYLENAIWHGLRYLSDKGQLTLTIHVQNNELVVTIADNGIGRDKSLELKTHNQKKQASIGMQNIENRITIMNDLFSTNIRVEITDALENVLNCGTKIKLFIPQKKQAHA